MIPYLAYVKWAAIAGLLVFVYHIGGNGPRAALERFRAEQSSLTAKAVLAERASAAVESTRVNAVLKEYQDAPIDPIVAGTAHRVFLYADPPSCPVPKAGADPARTVGAPAQPVGPSRIERSLGDYITACDADSRELAALIEAWPR